MKYIPHENIVYRTKLDAEEILKRIADNIEPKKLFRMTGFFGNGKHKPYEGNVNGMCFHMTRLIEYRNSFLPRIKGKVERDFNGSKISVKMTLHPFALIFMVIWLGFVGIAFMICLSLCIANKTFEPSILIPSVMLLFGYGLTTGGFKYESIKQKKQLAQLFEADIE